MHTFVTGVVSNVFAVHETTNNTFDIRRFEQVVKHKIWWRNNGRIVSIEDNFTRYFLELNNFLKISQKRSGRFREVQIFRLTLFFSDADCRGPVCRDEVSSDYSRWWLQYLRTKTLYSTVQVKRTLFTSLHFTSGIISKYLAIDKILT